MGLLPVERSSSPGEREKKIMKGSKQMKNGYARTGHLTEPIIPATNCFCMMKKISAVGSVAMTMPAIIMP